MIAELQRRAGEAAEFSPGPDWKHFAKEQGADQESIDVDGLRTDSGTKKEWPFVEGDFLAKNVFVGILIGVRALSEAASCEQRAKGAAIDWLLLGGGYALGGKRRQCV
jgi:hypothetical protein